MKAISIRQPWANLIVHDIKPIENRSWKTNFRGRVLVHAPVKDDSISTSYLADQLLQIHSGNFYDNPTLCSAIIGSVEIVDCVQNHESIWAEKDGWNWVLANPVLFKEPILNVKGKLSFWEYEGEVPELYLRCERCGNRNKDVEETVDPFQLEIHDKTVEIIVCHECYTELADEI